MREGVVYKTTGSWYIIKENDVFVKARLKGKHKIDTDINSTNPIAVGDKVLFEKSDNNSDEEDFMITEILPRNNYIVRSSPHNFRIKNIIAANLDQAILLATLRSPRTSLGFVDRFLVTAEMYHIPAILLYNKKDIYTDTDMEKYHKLKGIYEKLGYQTELISSTDESSTEEVNSWVRDKVSLISGHSGVGKSTLVAKLIPELDLKTTEISQTTDKGMHTTTFSQAYDLNAGGMLIDTPGIRELGLVDIERQELADYYPEMRELQGDCAFNDCLHLEEPKCAIKKSVDSGGQVSLLRYKNYRSILDSIEDRSY